MTAAKRRRTRGVPQPPPDTVRLEDSRYTTHFWDEGEMADVLDLDELDEVETLFMLMWDRPLTLTTCLNDLYENCLLFVFAGPGEHQIEVEVRFPSSVRELTINQRIVDVLRELGEYPSDSAPDWDPMAIHEEEWNSQIRIMGKCLGGVRMFGMFEPSE